VDSDWPLVSIVFVAYNRRDELAISLEHVFDRLDYPADRLEVIVVDNASEDETAEMVRERFPRAELIRNPENVGASAWNVGVTTARGDWRMILDDDCYITGDALKTAVHRAREHDADLVSFHPVSGVAEGYSFEEEYRTGLLSFWGCAALFSRRAIENEPFYDPNIFIWTNEMELTMRLLDRGFRHLYLPEVEPIHMKPPKPPFLEYATRVNARHLAYIAGKLLQPRDVPGAVANLALHVLFKGYSQNPRALLALLDIPRGLVRGLRVRSPVRPEISSVYRRHTWDFANPFPHVRSPLDRLGPAPGPEQLREARLARSASWFERRPRYYPASTTVLEL